MRRLALALLLAAPVAAQAPADPTAFADAATLHAEVAATERGMTPDQGFAYRPLLQADGKTVALEVWRKPGRPAVHPDEAEYALVVEGAGTLVSGGRLVDPVERRPGLVEGSRIEGGTTRRLAPGDVLLVPAGVPHWFGITGGKLVLLGTKMRR
jgi:mannose-6-phosphate isomerase-like protein (cupin superfamily)